MAAEEILEETEMRMMDAIEAMERDFAGYRTGKASPALVENLHVDYYGTQSRLREIAGITTPEPRLIVIQPWDKSAVSAIEKAIQASNVGISPVSDGRVIRLPIPELSEERRKDIAKQVKKRAEEARVAVRNVRRDANEQVKKAEKDHDLTEDLMHDKLAEVQELTDKYIKDIDTRAEAKESELMTI